jgi:uncharacterized protein YjbI with pentapeptide repeats
MANEEHLAILWQGVEVWNEWREKNPQVKPDISAVDLTNADLRNFNLSNVLLVQANLSDALLTQANLCKANLTGADLRNADLTDAYFRMTNFSNADLSGAFLVNVDLSGANRSLTDIEEADSYGFNLSGDNLIGALLCNAILINANLSHADLSGLDLSSSILAEANLHGTNFTGTNLTKSDLIKAQALGTNFTTAKFTGACIQDWNTNSATNLTDVICDYIYLRQGQKERRPSSGNFAPGEFAKLFQKSLETVDLIFRNGIDWNAFAYSFKKVEVENQSAYPIVTTIELKDDGIVLVKVAVAPDADKVKIHSEFIQGYEFAAKALEAQYQARLEDKDTLISKQEAQINRLFDIVEQQGSVQKALAENPRKVSNYNMQNPQFASGIVDANTVNSERISGNIHNNDA